jgi:hypothetical protein
MIDLHYAPINVFLNDSGIYVKSTQASQMIHKYNYNLDHVRSFAQNVDEKKLYFLPKNLKLIAIQHEKMYMVDYEHLRLRMINESNGKLLKEIEFEESKQRILFHVDPNKERVYFVNKSSFYIDIFDLNGDFLKRNDIDQRIEQIDNFFPLETSNSFAYVDKRNQMIHFF